MTTVSSPRLAASSRPGASGWSLTTSTIEGPILGAIIFYALQQSLASHGTWYFIILGLVAIAVALFARRGLWGLVADRLNIRVFPVGYWLWPAGEARRRRGLPGRRPRA